MRRITGKESTTLKRLSQSITKERIGIWKKYLSNNEIDEIKAIVRKNNLYDEFSNALWK